jgi:hypothetical protein
MIFVKRPPKVVRSTDEGLTTATLCGGPPWLTQRAAAVTLGVAIPALIYALTRVGAALYIDCHARA